MAAFPLSARDWIAYRNSLRGGNGDEAAGEPTPLTELKLLLLLLFCPSTTLRHLLECGALPPRRCNLSGVVSSAVALSRLWTTRSIRALNVAILV